MIDTAKVFLKMVQPYDIAFTHTNDFTLRFYQTAQTITTYCYGTMRLDGPD
jgi:hypothetical protein